MHGIALLVGCTNEGKVESEGVPFSPPVSSWCPPSWWRACPDVLSMLPPDCSNDRTARACRLRKTLNMNAYRWQRRRFANTVGRASRLPLFVLHKHVVEILGTVMEEGAPDFIQQTAVCASQLLWNNKYVNKALTLSAERLSRSPPPLPLCWWRYFQCPESEETSQEASESAAQNRRGDY